MAASSLEAKIGKEKCGVERSLQTQITTQSHATFFFVKEDANKREHRDKKRKIGMAGFNLELIEAVKEKTDNTVQKPVVDN
ncbi:hypothetical protein PoMZ_09460 [Pyricularia oryzae]|uniref:Uncharacterized protein n=1 Tax=Pyricularia oryzae TaxID=318829 RepID=A0A4P7N1Q1_PYROR|nr:hypothetical protein PoMZ_09460 [Pyricularia oryzae]